LVHRFWFLCDDAYITFRYAKNLARGYGVTFNVGEPPVEGYSDFGWLLLCAVFEALQLPVETLVPLVSSSMGAAFLLWFYQRCRSFYGLDLPAAAGALFGLALSPAVSVWATSGLEPMPFLVFTFLCFEGMAFGQGRWAVVGTCLAALGLAFVRTEGVAWVGVVAVLGLFARVVDQRRSTCSTRCGGSTTSASGCRTPPTPRWGSPWSASCVASSTRCSFSSPSSARPCSGWAPRRRYGGGWGQG
jgi:hypothetical protein